MGVLDFLSSSFSLKNSLTWGVKWEKLKFILGNLLDKLQKLYINSP